MAGEVRDDLLRMLFVCCDEAIPLESQLVLALKTNIRTFMERAGGTTDNIGHMTVYLKEERYRESINKEWLKMFPDEKDRPARHAIRVDVRGEVLFQIEIIAVI